MKYTDEQRVKKIYENATKLNRYIADHKITKESLISDYALQWLVTTPLYNIGEHVYRISDDYKNDHREIEWSMIAGLRHRLVHDYEGTNWSIVAEVVFDELPELIHQLKNILSEEKTDLI